MEFRSLRRAVTPVVFTTLVVLVLVYIAVGFSSKFVPGAERTFSYLELIADDVLDGELWRLVTYALIHNLTSPFHLIFNGLIIYFFGPDLELRWGRGRLLLFMLLTVVGGGAFVVAGSSLGISAPMAIGSSAFGEGLLIAWALTYPERPLRMMFVIPLRGVHLIPVGLFLWILDAVSQSGTSAAAHLGGMVTAAVLVLGVWRPNHLKAWWWSLLEKLRLKKKPKLYAVPGPKDKWVN